jgi:hypothetical protein
MDYQFDKLVFMNSILSAEQKEKFIKMKKGKGKKNKKGKK